MLIFFKKMFLKNKSFRKSKVKVNILAHPFICMHDQAKICKKPAKNTTFSQNLDKNSQNSGYKRGGLTQDRRARAKSV